MTGEWFRVACWGSRYGRDVLGVDILVAEAGLEGGGDGGEGAEGES